MILLVLWVVLWIGAGELQQVFIEVGDLRILPLGVLCKGLRHRVVRHQRAFLAAQQVKKFGGILYGKRRVFYPNRVDVARADQNAAGRLTDKDAVANRCLFEIGRRYRGGREGPAANQNVKLYV